MEKQPLTYLTTLVFLFCFLFGESTDVFKYFILPLSQFVLHSLNLFLKSPSMVLAASLSSGPDAYSFSFVPYVAPRVMTPMIDFAFIFIVPFSIVMSERNLEATEDIMEAGRAWMPALLRTSSVFSTIDLLLCVCIGVKPSGGFALKPFEDRLVEFLC